MEIDENDKGLWIKNRGPLITVHGFTDPAPMYFAQNRVYVYMENDENDKKIVD